MVRWMCGVSLNDRKRSVDLYSLLGVQSVAVVVVLHVLMTELGFQFKGNFDEFFGNGNNVKHDRFRWLGHLERIGVWNPCE